MTTGKSYLFYDIETSGLSKSFDQILQFAAIRTDTHLNETQRYNIKVKLLPDIIPSAGAAITHRIGVYDTQDGVTEVEAARHIHAILNTPGTISLGYNTLGFDDEFLRFTFFRNLLEPYTHQYLNGCGRMDLLPFAVIYYLYKNDILKWPDVDGKNSLKLEHLSSLNNLATGQAHDAMVDVEATLALARVFHQEKQMWDYISGYFDKNSDKARIDSLPVSFESSAGLHLSGLMTGVQFGADLSYQSPVLYLGESVPYKGQSLWLRLDDDNLSSTTEETLDQVPWVFRKKMGEPNIILPPVQRFLAPMASNVLNTARQNSSWLQSNEKLLKKIITYYRNYEYEVIDGVDPDASIYLNGFMSSKDKQVSRKFHNAGFQEKRMMIEAFEDKVTRELAARILARNYENENGQTEKRTNLVKSVFAKNNDTAIIDFRGETKKTAEAVLGEIQSSRNEKDLDEEQMKILDELQSYIEQRVI